MFLVTFSTLGPRGPPDGPKMAPGGPKASIYHDFGPFLRVLSIFGDPMFMFFGTSRCTRKASALSPRHGGGDGPQGTWII